jgi:hypothetical protein
MKVSSVVLLSASCFFFSFTAGPNKTEKVLEVEKLIIKNPRSKASIEMQIVGDKPIISLKNEKGLALVNLFIDEEGNAQISLNDQTAMPRLELRGGAVPSFFLLDKNQMAQGGLFTLAEGGGGLALCNAQGKISALVRGGENPGINLYEHAEEPTIALGVVSTVPHLFISGKYSTDGMLIHGGEPTSLLFIDNKGEVQVAVSRLGFYTKQVQDTEKKQERPQLFSLDEFKNKLKETNRTR